MACSFTLQPKREHQEQQRDFPHSVNWSESIRSSYKLSRSHFVWGFFFFCFKKKILWKSVDWLICQNSNCPKYRTLYEALTRRRCRLINSGSPREVTYLSRMGGYICSLVNISKSHIKSMQIYQSFNHFYNSFSMRRLKLILEDLYQRNWHHFKRQRCEMSRWLRRTSSRMVGYVRTSDTVRLPSVQSGLQQKHTPTEIWCYGTL